MQPGIKTFVRLAADQSVPASTVLVDLGAGTSAFSFTLKAGKVVNLFASLPFNVGATGGFKFQITASQTPQDYSVRYEAIDGVTASPGAQVASIIAAQAAFANPWAVAGNHLCDISASFKGHATLDATVTIQFACNSAANAITILKGAWMEVTQL